MAGPTDQHSEERLSAVIDTAVDGVIIIDEDGRIQVFNRACENLFGYTSDEVVGENVNILMPSPDREEHDGYIGNYRRTGKRKIIGIGREVTGQRKDGSTFPMELSVGEGFQDDGHFFVGIIRDITERKSAEQAIARSVDELAAFAYSVAHDLKAPLRAIDGFAHALSEDYGGSFDAEGRDYLTQVTDATERMGDMIDDLLEYSRIGTDSVSFDEVSVREICESAVGALDGLIRETGAEVTITGDWIDIEAHRPTLLSTFQNLISNALKFVVPGIQPKVTVSSQVDARQLQIEISDNGIGIEPDYREKVFQIFHRLHDRNEYPGTGIGLAMVKKSVQVHHGRIEIDSALNQGSTFRIFLPRRQPELPDGRESRVQP